MADELNSDNLPKLKDNWLRFVDEYERLNFKNGTKAAIAAGFAEKSARVAANRLLTNHNIRVHIEHRMKRQIMPPSEVLIRLSQHAGSSMEDFIKRDGNLAFLDLEKAEEAAQLHLIKKFKITKRGIEVELYDAQSALVQLGRHYGLFTDKLQVEDWRTQAIADIKAGAISYKALAEAFDDDLATELFTRAGVPVSTG